MLFWNGKLLNVSDVRKTFSMHFKVTLGFGPFSWSTSKSYVHASQTLTGRKHRMIDIQVHVHKLAAENLSLTPPPNAKNYVKKM